MEKRVRKRLQLLYIKDKIIRIQITIYCESKCISESVFGSGSTTASCSGVDLPFREKDQKIPNASKDRHKCVTAAHL